MEENLLTIQDSEAGVTALPQKSFSSGLSWGLALTVLILLNVGDIVLVTVLFDEYTEHYALFLNQGTAFVYIIVCSLILLVMRCKEKNEGPPTNSSRSFVKSDSLPSPPPPRWVLVVIGLLNGLANFFMAIAQPHTAGLTQSLLGLLGIPLVLFLSWVYLGISSSGTSIFAATLIVIGALLSSLRNQFFPNAADDSGGVVVYWYSSAVFAIGQIFLGFEKVFEEHTFSKYSSVHVLVMFYWTLWTQFILGWALYPVQTISIFGGLSLSDLPSVVWDGMKCSVGISSPNDSDTPVCNWVDPTLFFVYCAVDFSCYAWGLYVIQKGGANLMVIASAVALPLQQVVFVLKPVMGSYYETFYYTDGLALLLVLAGFLVYYFLSREGVAKRQG